MAEIARVGRGRYHVTTSPTSLPALIVRETQYHQPPAARRVEFRPHVVTQHRLLGELDPATGPPLSGHALSQTRPGATTILSASDASSPLLAHWFVGAGQVATFTSSSTGGWANAWRAWPGFRTFFDEVVRGLVRARTAAPLSVQIDPVPSRPGARRVTVLGSSTAMTPAPVVTLARDRTSTAAPLAVAPAGPGIWSAEVDASSGFLVAAKLPSEPEPTAAAAFDAVPEELVAFGADRPALEGWAAAGAGRVVDAPERALDAPPTPALVGRSLQTWLLALALVLYLLALLLLRLPDAALALSGERARAAAPASGSADGGPRPARAARVERERKEAA